MPDDNSMDYLALVILSEISRMEPVLEELATNTEISGITILSSRGISRDGYQQIVSDFSVGGALSRLFESRKHQDRTFIIALHNDEELEQLEEILEAHVGDLDEPGTANLVALPVAYSRGFQQIDVEAEAAGADESDSQ